MYKRQFQSDSEIVKWASTIEIDPQKIIDSIVSVLRSGADNLCLLYTSYRKGAIMALLAVAGLVTGILGGKYGAYASSGFARNLRKAMYTNIQTFSCLLYTSRCV